VRRRGFDINMANRSYEDVSKFRYLGTTVVDKKIVTEENKNRLNSGSACHKSVQHLLSSCLLSKNATLRLSQTIILPLVLYVCQLSLSC
jgi:hypothetical protein